MKTVDFSEHIPVAYETDVLVLGGGPAGISAALSAARLGAKVMVIEQTNALGGIATSGLHGHICIYSPWADKSTRIVGGICYEIALRTQERGTGRFNGEHLDFEVEPMKLLFEDLAKDAKIKLLYYTQFSDVTIKDGRISETIIQSKNGREAISARTVIDCTGDADAAFRAGVQCEKGREKDGATQPMTLMFQIGGIDFEKVNRFRTRGYREKYGADDSYKMSKVWLEAQKNGDMEAFQDAIMGWWWTPTRPDQLGINFTHIAGGDCTRTQDITHATIEGRRQAFHCIDVYRKYVPGMENCWMSHCAALIGTRESRRIKGRHVITEQEILAEKEFSDSIGYGSFFIDIHNCTGPGMDKETFRPKRGFKYQIPFRALVPETISNLLVAGRCISCTHTALGSLRVMPQCMLEGEAAGAAAYLAARNSVPTGNVDINELQDLLRKQNAIISHNDIVE